MNVLETISYPNAPDHFVEFGEAGWDLSVQSIRRRKNNPNGSYDPISSSEIPIDGGFIDIAELICLCLKRDKIPTNDMLSILDELRLSAARINLQLP